MRFTIKRDSLLDALQRVAGAVERRHTLPILANTLFGLRDEQLFLTATDLDIEMVAKTALPPVSQTALSGSFTVATRKLLDICRALPEDAELDFTVKETTVILTAQRSRFTLATLPAQDFPQLKPLKTIHSFTLAASELYYLFHKTAFAMGQQDIRYYLNGLLLEIAAKRIRAVATDGHRLALSTIIPQQASELGQQQFLIPRKAIQELLRLLANSDELLTINVSEHHIQIIGNSYSFTTKLIDGQFPAYERVLPQSNPQEIVINKDEFKQALSRAAILASHKLRGACLQFLPGKLKIIVNNTDYEEAEIEIDTDFAGEQVDVGLNIGYLLDALAAITTPMVKLQFSDAASRILLTELDNANNQYIIMPMRV